MKSHFLILLAGFTLTLTSCGIIGISKSVDEASISVSNAKNQEPLNIYYINEADGVKGGKQIAFISLSDIYPISEHPDSLPIPDISEKPYDSIQYFDLTGTYRKRFLEGTGISENDKVFLFDYSTGKQLSFPVKRLTVAACLNGYISESDMPILPYYYEFGFGIDSALVTEFNTDGYYSNTLVYVGKESPFVTKKLTLLEWIKVDPKQFPDVKSSPEISEELKGFRVKETYFTTVDSLDYFTREGILTGDRPARHVVIQHKITKEIVFERGYAESEGIGIAPLNLSNPEYPARIQWTGQLFKDRSPVIFGFLYHSFDCERIAFIGGEQVEFSTNCDNRH